MPPEPPATRAAALVALLAEDDRWQRFGSAGGTRPHLELVERACRLWLDLDGRPDGVLERVGSWCRRHPQAATARFVEVRAALGHRGTEAASEVLRRWGAGETDPLVGHPRWWAERLVRGVATGTIAHRSAPTTEPSETHPHDEWRGSWLDHLAGSLQRTAPGVGTQLVSVRGGPADPGPLVEQLRERLAEVGLRVLRCDLDARGGTNPLAGWLDVLWDDVHWNLLGDRRLARVASAVDRQLGRGVDAAGCIAGTGAVDGRRTDEVLVEVLRRLARSFPDPIVVLVSGSDPALRWLDRFVDQVGAAEGPGGDALGLVIVRHRPAPTGAVTPGPTADRTGTTPKEDP